MIPLRGVLEICIPTYNRAEKLEKTLRAFVSSPFSVCKLTVLNNCSTDATSQVVERLRGGLPRLHLVTHGRNIGASPNYLRAVEVATAPYCWVLGDDDELDFSSCDRIIAALEQQESDLIPVSGHGVKEGVSDVSSLLQEGYSFFGEHGWISSLIFKTSCFDSSSLHNGYRNVPNLFPHLPFLIAAAEKNLTVSVIRQQLVRLTPPDGLNFAPLAMRVGWVRGCRTFAPKTLLAQAVRQWDSGRSATWSILRDILGDKAMKRTAFKILWRRYVHLILDLPWRFRLGSLLALPLLFLPTAFCSRLREWKHRNNPSGRLEIIGDPFRS